MNLLHRTSQGVGFLTRPECACQILDDEMRGSTRKCAFLLAHGTLGDLIFVVVGVVVGEMSISTQYSVPADVMPTFG
jgi:hypothetical protein